MSRNPYETRRYLDEYLLFHYDKPRDICPFPFVPQVALRFHERIVDECLPRLRFPSPTRALDIGCGVGRLTFELTRVVDNVVGVDSSKCFIEAAQRLAHEHHATVSVKEEGDHATKRRVSLPRTLRNGRAEFCVGDAQNLASLAGQPFHVVTLINLLCRLPNPRKFLSQLPDLVAPHGYLVIASPYSWLKEFTPRRHWIAPGTLPALLRPHFRLVSRRDLPFLIREHRRKYQFVVSEVLTFQRRR